MDIETGRWMTKAEIASVRRITVASADRLIRRQKWRKQQGNDGKARVLVPLSWTEPDDCPTDALGPATDDQPEHPTDIHLSRALIVLETALTALGERASASDVRADRAEDRANRAEEHLARERERADRAEAEVRALRQAEIERRRRGLFPRLLSGWRNH